MKVHQFSTVLITNDFQAMKDFYMKVLQQEIANDFGNCIGFKSGISLWELKPQYPLAKRLGRTQHPGGNPNLELCFEIEDFEETMEHLKQFDLNYLHGVEEETWGQYTVRFYDPQGNLIEMGETIPGFVLRLHQGGLSPQEVSQKTSLPLELVQGYLEG